MKFRSSTYDRSEMDFGQSPDRIEIDVNGNEDPKSIKYESYS